VLRGLQGSGYDEMSEIVEVSVGALRIRLHRAREVVALLSDYVDGELNEDVHSAVDSHVRLRKACTEEVERLQKNLMVLKRLNEREPPWSFLDFTK